MIARIWHGYTSPQQAQPYENLLKEEIFVGIENKKIPGYKGIQLLKRDLGDEVEFTTIMWFENIQSVKHFVGEDYSKAYIPDTAKQLLSRFDVESIHCELLTSSTI